VRDSASSDRPIGSAALIATLRAAGCVFAEDEARLLLEAGSADPAALAALVDRRIRGEPLEHVLGWTDFAGLRVALGPGVFVPRQRSELLVAQAVELVTRARWRHTAIIDLCCGSGAVGVALATRLAGAGLHATLHATDSDPRAVYWARRNVRAAGGQVYQGDLYRPLPGALRGSARLVVVVAPYVPTPAIPLLPSEARDHEPSGALDGGDDGLTVVRRVIAEAPDWLAPDGRLLVEIGQPQIEEVRAALRRAGLTARIVVRDEPDAVVAIGSRNGN
jgi:release factor glutamine methyltransferase